MSGGLKHPLTKLLYICTSDGKIRVEDGKKHGLFNRDGSWIEGELREADPHFCGWVAGDRVTRRGLDIKAD